jgi:L-alanine-DL-glutamate epimerase-like enolase superfamily enzyme
MAASSSWISRRRFLSVSALTAGTGVLMGCYNRASRVRRAIATKRSDIRVAETTLHFLPVRLRVPLKFGSQVITEITCARVRVRVAGRDGQSAEGWGETPLSTQWVWPSALPLSERTEALLMLCQRLAREWAGFASTGHALEVGHDFQEEALPAILDRFNRERSGGEEPAPWLAALLCCSPFDQAVHDAFGQLTGRPIYTTYGPEFLNRDLGDLLESSERFSFSGKYPADFLVANPPRRLMAVHLVGGLDLLDSSEQKGDEPRDGYPVLLPDWIRRDGLKALKVKLRGTDAAWDFARLVKVGQIALGLGVEHLSTDFNCTVDAPAYVIEILERLRREHSQIFERLRYDEQPFPYELKEHPIDVHELAAIKPLFLDESAHDWRLVRFGQTLGWNGVALKTCKTQTGALKAACWAKAHGMKLMVQDLTNPMLAMIPHVELAAHVGTIMGVEVNAMQYYPAVSAPEAVVHPGLYQRRGGEVDFSSVRGSGFGYRIKEIRRELPPPVAQFTA